MLKGIASNERVKSLCKFFTLYKLFFHYHYFACVHVRELCCVHVQEVLLSLMCVFVRLSAIFMYVLRALNVRLCVLEMSIIIINMLLLLLFHNLSPSNNIKC